jgi:hypothetical protein
MRILNASHDIYLYSEPDDKGGKCECELCLLDRKIAKNKNSEQLNDQLMRGISRILRMDPTIFTSRFDRSLYHFYAKKLIYRPKLIGFKTIYSPFRLGWIRKQLNFPKTIWLIRNPYSHCLSRIHLAEMIKSSLKARINRRDKMSNIVHQEYETDLIKFATVWKKENESAILENQDDDNFKIVVYENLCEDPFSVATEIFEFLEVKYDHKVNGCIQKTVLPPSSKNPISRILSNGYFSTRKDPLDSAHRWKKTISDEQKLAISKVVNDSFLMDFFASTL